VDAHNGGQFVTVVSSSVARFIHATTSAAGSIYTNDKRLVNVPATQTVWQPRAARVCCPLEPRESLTVKDSKCRGSAFRPVLGLGNNLVSCLRGFPLCAGFRDSEHGLENPLRGLLEGRLFVSLGLVSCSQHQARLSLVAQSRRFTVHV